MNPMAHEVLPRVRRSLVTSSTRVVIRRFIGTVMQSFVEAIGGFRGFEGSL